MTDTTERSKLADVPQELQDAVIFHEFAAHAGSLLSAALAKIPSIFGKRSSEAVETIKVAKWVVKRTYEIIDAHPEGKQFTEEEIAIEADQERSEEPTEPSRIITPR